MSFGALIQQIYTFFIFHWNSNLLDAQNAATDETPTVN